MDGESSENAPIVPRNGILLLAAAIALSFGGLQLSHLIELPFGGWLSATTGSVVSTSSLLAFMRDVGYLSLFVLMAIDGASLPIPSEIALLFAGYLVYLGLMDFWLALAVSTAAGLSGALLDYYLARWLGRRFIVRVLKAFGMHRGALDRAERWFEKSGQWTVLAARFIPVVRTVISFPAGLFRMGLGPFVLMTAIGCFAWSAIIVYAGYLAGPAWDTVFTASSSAVFDAIAVVVVLVAALYIAYYAYGKRSRSLADPSLQTSVS